MEISIIPAFIIKRITPNSIRQINWNILISSCLVLFAAKLLTLNDLNAIPHFCLFEKLTGYPCPGCGITRSIMCVGNLDFLDAVRFNPNGIIITMAFLFQIPMRAIALLHEDSSPTINNVSKRMTQLIVISLFIVWIYNIINLKF